MTDSFWKGKLDETRSYAEGYRLESIILSVQKGKLGLERSITGRGEGWKAFSPFLSLNQDLKD